MTKKIEKKHPTNNQVYEAKIYCGSKYISTVSLSENQIQRLKFEIWNDYNHNLKNSLMACGLTENRLEGVGHRIVEILRKFNRPSEVCEEVEKILTTRELAFFATEYIIQSMEKAQAMAHLYEMLHGKLHDEEGDN